MSKTLLILGNGFDLAHGLPTKYSDFLMFCEKIEDLFRYESIFNADKSSFFRDEIINWNIDETIKKAVLDVLNMFNNPKNEKHKKEAIQKIEYETLKIINNDIYENVWYFYLTKIYRRNLLRGENWIDFESEISFIIETLDKNTLNMQIGAKKVIDNIKFNDEIMESKNRVFKELIGRYVDNLNIITMNRFRERLFNDLERINEALKVYLCCFVEEIPIMLFSEDIKKIKPDFVLNFNYTNTYERVYGDSAEVFHIHGSCNNEEGKDNNMVLGIDEYWKGPEKDEYTNFTIFKKFAQRIQKMTGVKHIDFYNKLKVSERTTSRNYCEPCEVYIFGHSLDVTDKDILKLFLSGYKTYIVPNLGEFKIPFNVTVFCKDKEKEGEYIANIIKIIGEDTLIEKVNKNPPDINFVIQSAMVDKVTASKPQTIVPAT